MPSDDPVIQGYINAANAAETSGDANARASAATAALTAMAEAQRSIPSATPATAVEAGKRLEHLGKDAAWRDRYLAGDVSAKHEFELLNSQIRAADPVELAIGGVTPPAGLDENSGSIVGEHDLPAAVNHLRDRGYTDMHIREIMTGKLLADDGRELSDAQIVERVTNAERQLERLSKDAEFRRKYLSGDKDAASIMSAITATIAAGNLQ
jgi:hypothetical protein